MSAKDVNLFFPRRNNQVWVCVAERASVHERADASSSVVGQIRKGERVFEFQRVDKFNCLWVGFFSDSRTTDDQLGHGADQNEPRLCWAATNKNWTTPVLERVEQCVRGHGSGQVFDIARRLSICDPVVPSEQMGRDVRSEGNADRDFGGGGENTRHALEECRSTTEKNLDKSAARDGDRSLNPLNKQDGSIGNSDRDHHRPDNPRSTRLQHAADAGGGAAGKVDEAIGPYSAGLLCSELSTIVAAITSQARDIVISHSKNSKYAQEKTNTLGSQLPIARSLQNLYTIDSIQPGRGMASVGALWAHMDIINNIQSCCSREESAAAFKAYVMAGCHGGAHLELLASDLNAWVTQFFLDRADLKPMVHQLHKFLLMENRNRRQPAQITGCFSVLAVLEMLCDTGQTFAHQELMWADPNKNNSDEMDTQSGSGPLQRQKIVRVPIFQRVMGAASAALTRVLHRGERSFTIGVGDTLSSRTRESLRPLILLIHKVYSLPQFRQQRLWHLRTKLQSLKFATAVFRVLPAPPVYLLGSERNLQRVLMESNDCGSVLSKTSPVCSPTSSPKGLRKQRSASRDASAKVSDVVVEFMDSRKTKKANSILAVYSSELKAKLADISVKMQQIDYLKEVLSAQNAYFREMLENVCSGLASGASDDGVHRLLRLRTSLHAELADLTRESFCLAETCIRRRLVVVATLSRSLKEEAAGGGKGTAESLIKRLFFHGGNATAARQKVHDMRLLQVLQYCSKPEYILAQDQNLLEILQHWLRVKKQLRIVDSELSGHIDNVLQALRKDNWTQATRLALCNLARRSVSIILAPTVHALDNALNKRLASHCKFLSTQWKAAAEELRQLCAHGLTSSCGAFVQFILVPEVQSRLKRIRHGNEMAVCRLSAQKSPHAQASREGNITGTPARPHASFWRQTDLPHSLHASTPRPAFCTALPQSQTLKYLHDMRIILRLIRRCSACLAEELYWMCVNSGQDFSLVDATRATVEDNLPSTTPTSTIQHIARAVLFAQCEEMFFRLFYDDLASSFAPHQSKICSEATVRSLIHSAELLDGVCVRAIETHFEDQCSVIATTSCLKHIGFSCKAAQLLGLDIDTIVSDGIGAGVLSNSCQIFIETLNLRGRVSMNDGIACLLQYIVKDMATHDTAEANVGTDEMFPGLIFVVVAVSQAGHGAQLLQFVQVLSLLNDVYADDNANLGLESSSSHGLCSYALATLHAAIKWIVDASSEEISD